MARNGSGLAGERLQMRHALFQGRVRAEQRQHAAASEGVDDEEMGRRWVRLQRQALRRGLQAFIRLFLHPGDSA